MRCYFSSERILFPSIYPILLVLLLLPGDLLNPNRSNGGSYIHGVDASYNLLMARDEVQRLLGLPSDIYLVREGVVNEYALNFVVNVPTTIEHLHFKWQSLVKKPVHYEMVIEYADLFTLFQPMSNISNVGRVPQKLDTFRVSLPCSGRSSMEVPVIIRFSFSVKHTKHHNLTVINVKRNKICLQKGHPPDPKGHSGPPTGDHPGSKTLPKNTRSGNFSDQIPGYVFPDAPSPSLLLAGLLGGCGVTASVVSVVFFICLRRKLLKLDLASSSTSSYISPGSTNNRGGCGPSQQQQFSKDELAANNFDSSDSSSPACLIRNKEGEEASKNKYPPLGYLRSKSIGGKGTFGNESILSRSSGFDPKSPNNSPYANIFWNQFFSTKEHNKGPDLGVDEDAAFLPSESKLIKNWGFNQRQTDASAFPHVNPLNNQNCNQSEQFAKGSDVSPYAYAHIVGIQPPPTAPPPPPSQPPNLPSGGKGQSTQLLDRYPASGMSPLIDWYSESGGGGARGGGCGSGHIYANRLGTFKSTSSNESYYESQQQLGPSRKKKGVIKCDDGNYDLSSLKENNYSSLVTTTERGRDANATLGSESLIQIDGFQCRKSYPKETNVIERFL